ncbi:hypothetical protein VPNG_03148 [Cytospora leucostoma]|uniref:Exocyst complex component EXO84 n=1 Tax=Cytospora leucostoma TaxID=1230097 RepID=A0A423XES7_9PEZI|nr:hypothetical protein VPNG_03148 [Cytospora leucostoma]
MSEEPPVKEPARRGISLRSGTRRKARPVISAPRQILEEPASNNEGAPAVPRSVGGAKPVADGAASRARQPPQARGKTSDYVKRRYSTRYNMDNIDVTAAPPIPTMPALDKYAPYRKPTMDLPPPPGGAGVAPTVDIKVLRNPGFNPDAYVTNTLANATEDEIPEFEEQLQKLKVRASSDLQQNVYQNRTQFIKISKEAEKLKEEMRSLKNLMSELKTNTTVLRSASSRNEQSPGMNGGSFSSGMSKKDKRSSVVDRAALWTQQMQALYKMIEGSQKFLPNSAGRHIVQDAGSWIELDNATYKSRRSIQIVLLNDHLLIASRKKRKTDNPEARGPAIKLVADRCWPLLDIEVVDMAGTHESSSSRTKLADAIMVRGVGQESVIYKTEKPDDPEKRSLMLNIRKVVEDLRRSIQSERDANNKAKETINYFASRDPGLLQKAELLETLSDIKDMLIEVDGNQHNLRWVESQMDELDIDIALQRIEPAVARVEQLKGLARNLKNNPVAQDFIEFKVEERCSRLAGLITRELANTHDEPSKNRLNVSWLTRLGYEDQAREAYLEARSGTIHKRARQCIFQGDLHLYIWQLSLVYFTIIKNTVSCFQICFPPPMMSACVKWAKDEVEAFNVILARQLSSTEHGSEAWIKCMEQAKEHAKVLSEVGLDFRYLVGREPAAVNGGHEPNGPVGLGLS